MNDNKSSILTQVDAVSSLFGQIIASLLSTVHWSHGIMRNVLIPARDCFPFLSFSSVCARSCYIILFIQQGVAVKARLFSQPALNK